MPSCRRMKWAIGRRRDRGSCGEEGVDRKGRRRDGLLVWQWQWGGFEIESAELSGIERVRRFSG